MARHVATVVVMAFAVYTGFPFELHAATFPHDQPPLGILIAPEGGPNPTLESKRHTPTRNQRPLGILLGPETAFPPRIAAPAQSVTQPATIIPALARPIIHTPAPQQSRDRPLGVLIGRRQPSRSHPGRQIIPAVRFPHQPRPNLLYRQARQASIQPP